MIKRHDDNGNATQQINRFDAFGGCAVIFINGGSRLAGSDNVHMQILFQIMLKEQKNTRHYWNAGPAAV
jgi:hypothetical protein